MRLLLYKSTQAGTDMQKQMTDFQPKMQEIQEKHKDDPKKMSEETMKLFKQNGGGPLKGCLTMLLQIPIFLWLFYVVQDFAKLEVHTELYSFLQWLNVDYAHPITTFFGIDLLVSQNILLTVLAALLMYLQMQLTTLTKPAAAPKMPGAEAMPDMTKMMGSMNIFFVVMMGLFVRGTPAAIGLYIVTSTLFGVVQQTIQYWPVVKIKLKSLFPSKKPIIISE